MHMATRRQTPKNIDEYVARFPPEVQAILERIRATIRKAAPGAQEVISYQIPAFTLNGALVYFAAFKNHIGFYPPVRDNASLEKAISPYAGEKGNLRFPSRSSDPVPADRANREASREAELGEGGGHESQDTMSDETGCERLNAGPWTAQMPSHLNYPEVIAMATVRKGNKGVLLVVDVQVGVMSEAWEAPRIINNVSRAVERARAQGVPVIWVQHSDKDLPHGSPQWQWVPELAPAEGEPLIHKSFNSSFEQTALEEELARLGATHIALAGAATNWCIRATAYGALDRGYDLTLIKDAHTTGTIELDNGVRIEAESVVHDLNVAMNWLSYPGRTNGTATAEEVEFAMASAAQVA